MNDEIAAVRSPLRGAQQPLVVKQTMPPPAVITRNSAPAAAAAAASAISADAERNIVVLRDWSFAKLVANSKHLGFRAVGTLVYHPRVNDSSFGSDWFSTEIRGIHSSGVVVSSNMSLYRLDGPAAPARHNAQTRLAAIMQPFCRSTWPQNAESLLEQVSKFFRSDEYVSTPSQPSAAAVTPSSSAVPSQPRGYRQKKVVEVDEDDQYDDDDDNDDEDEEEEEEEEEPPPRRKGISAVKQKPSVAKAKVKSSLSKTKAESKAKSSASSRSSGASASGPATNSKASTRPTSSRAPKSKVVAAPVKVVRKKKKRLSILKQPDVMIIAGDTDGPVDSIAKRSVTSRGRVSRRPLEFWKNERFEYDINKEVKAFSQASLPPTPVRQLSFSDSTASGSKDAPLSSRATSANGKLPPASAPRAVAGSKKRVVESSSDSESPSDGDAAPIVQQRKTAPPATKKTLPTAKSNAPAKLSGRVKASSASSKAPVAGKSTTPKDPPPKSSSASLPKRVPARRTAPTIDSSSDDDEDIPAPRRPANRVSTASRTAHETATDSKASAAAPVKASATVQHQVAVLSQRKQSARGSSAQPAAVAATKQKAPAKSSSSRAVVAAATAAPSDSEQDVFEATAARASSKTSDSMAVKFSTASALLASDPAASAGDDDDDCTKLFPTAHNMFLISAAGHPAHLAKLVHAVQACPPTPGGFWNEVAKHVGKSAAACRNRFFSEQSTPAPSKPKRQRRRPTTEVVDMARAGTIKHREQFRANIENLNEGHQVQEEIKKKTELAFCSLQKVQLFSYFLRMIFLRAPLGVALLKNVTFCSMMKTLSCRS
jgi:hypothetical protein